MRSDSKRATRRGVAFEPLARAPIRDIEALATPCSRNTSAAFARMAWRRASVSVFVGCPPRT